MIEWRQTIGWGVREENRSDLQQFTRSFLAISSALVRLLAVNSTMSLSIQFDSVRKLLLVSYGGEFSLSDAQSTFQEVLEAIVEHGVKKILVDGRQIDGDPEPLERFYYGKYVADAVSQTVNRMKIDVPRFAYVLEEPVLDPMRFGETVAVNRGMRVKAFDDIKRAEWWLGVSSAE
jgi:hypothetical protein